MQLKLTDKFIFVTFILMAVPVKVFSVLFTLFKRMDILLLMSFIPKNYDYGKTNTSFRKKQLIFSKPDLMNETFTVI